MIIEAASVVLVRKGCFLLVERGHEPSKGQYAFPGGRLDLGETAEVAARRELLEETGLQASAMHFLKTLVLEGPALNADRYRLHLFACPRAEGTVRAGDDAASLGWFSVREMAVLPVTPSTLEFAEQYARSNFGQNRI